MYSKLQYISQGVTATDQLYNIEQALDAGCTWVQLRSKQLTASELMPLAERVKMLCDSFGAILIINDNPLIAKSANAGGVHLGLDDMPVREARSIVGDKIIGGTANTLADVLQRVEEGCSYIGLGPFRFTTTKEKLSPVLGIAGYGRIMEVLKKQDVTVPVYAIGGILPGDVPALMRTGVFGVAVSGIITNHQDKKSLIQQFNSLLYEQVSYSG